MNNAIYQTTSRYQTSVRRAATRWGMLVLLTTWNTQSAEVSPVVAEIQEAPTWEQVEAASVEKIAELEGFITTSDTEASLESPRRVVEVAENVVPPTQNFQLPESTKDEKLYSFNADGLELKTALALFARANGLNIVPDNTVAGAVTLSVHDLPLNKIMQALLEAYDYSWSDEDGLIRVRAAETRMFQVDYLRLDRKGNGKSSATLTSASSGGAEGGGGGGGGGNEQGGSSIDVTQENPVAFWTELKEEIGMLLTPTGKQNLAINETAGLVQITDRPSALKRVEIYLEQIHQSVLRQVDIQARLYDVTLTDQSQYGIDWSHGFSMVDGGAVVGGSPTVVQPSGGSMLSPASFSTVFANQNTDIVLQALEEQGRVQVISQPRLRTLNNQTALIKVGTEMPFFNQTTTFLPGTFAANTTTAVESDQIQLITVGTILYITPQISESDWITMDLSPVITSLVETRISPSQSTTAPVLDIKQASTLVRMKSGQTIVIGGLIQGTIASDERKVPLLGDIPGIGLLFRGTVKSTEKKELVIFLTPRIVS
jgi:MSHA biogenesis protein MshL